MLRIRSVEEIRIDLNNLDFDTNERLATKIALTLLTEIVGAFYAANSTPKPYEAWALRNTISALNRDLFNGRYYNSERTIAGFLDSIMTDKSDLDSTEGDEGPGWSKGDFLRAIEATRNLLSTEG